MLVEGITKQDKEILNKFLDNTEYYPRYEVKVFGKRIEVDYFCRTVQSAELCAGILLKVPGRSKVIITELKNEYKREIIAIVKMKRVKLSKNKEKENGSS